VGEKGNTNSTGLTGRKKDQENVGDGLQGPVAKSGAIGDQRIDGAKGKKEYGRTSRAV